MILYQRVPIQVDLLLFKNSPSMSQEYPLPCWYKLSWFKKQHVCRCHTIYFLLEISCLETHTHTFIVICSAWKRQVSSSSKDFMSHKATTIAYFHIFPMSPCFPEKLVCSLCVLKNNTFFHISRKFSPCRPASAGTMEALQKRTPPWLAPRQRSDLGSWTGQHSMGVAMGSPIAG